MEIKTWSNDLYFGRTLSYQQTFKSLHDALEHMASLKGFPVLESLVHLVPSHEGKVEISDFNQAYTIVVSMKTWHYNVKAYLLYEENCQDWQRLELFTEGDEGSYSYRLHYTKEETLGNTAV